MISVAEAFGLILQHRPRCKTHKLPIADAYRKTLADDVRAKVSKPPQAVSAMDGYAVRLSNVRKQNAVLQIIGEAPAGRPFGGKVSDGQAVRIFTGAELPAGANHIVIQEDVFRTGDTIECKGAYEQPRHIRVAGLDFSEGDEVLAKGTVLSAYDISIAASANHAELNVFRPLNVALISNGDELKPPGSKLKPGEIIASNQMGLGALAQEWGADIIDLGIASDSVGAILEKIAEAPASTDVFVAIGGASVGDHDHMRRAFSAAGFEFIFEKIAIRPGKPTWFARRGDQCVLGLPGNPASAFVCAHLFLRPLLYSSSELTFVAARLNASMAANGPREAYIRAVAHVNENAQLEVRPFKKQDSSLLSPLSHANCLIRRAPNAKFSDEADIVDVFPLSPFSFA